MKVFGPATSERAKYFGAGVADDVRDRLSDKDRVSGVAPAAIETVPNPSRYDRQARFAPFGEDGQRRLADARV